VLKARMVEASCHCGAVRVQVQSPPENVTDCNCSICRRYGALWAYYHPKDVIVSGTTDIYMHGDRMIEFHRCKTCGCITHWSPADKSRDRMGVNVRMMAPEIVAKARVRKLDGADTWKVIE
jgi:hypothetical protein